MANLTESIAKMINGRKGLNEAPNEGEGTIQQGEEDSSEVEGRYLTYDELDSMPEETNTVDAGYDRLALAAACATNDFHHIHLYARGQDFDTTHPMAQEYYEKANEEVDLFAELAIEKMYFIPNLSTAASYLDWETEGLSSYQYEEAINAMRRVMTTYISYISFAAINSPDADVKNQLEEIQRFWEKELNYKLERRS